MTRRDPDAVEDFVERSATVFAEWGFPRMAARVLMLVMTTDETSLTAPQIADGLGISPAAVSGAVRYLCQVGILERRRVPGSRKDAFRLRGDHWYASTATVNGVYATLAGLAAEGVQALQPDTPAGRRVAEMQDFFTFVQAESADLIERWRASRQD